MDDESGIEISPSDLEIGNVVGNGATATVHEGYMGQLQVAIKVIAIQKGSFAKPQQQAFTREVAIMSKVRHPNLVQLHGIVIATDGLQLVTEFCSGGSLFEFLHEQPEGEEVDLRWSQQLEMCKNVASAVDYLHQFRPQIIHRDLKSPNLLLAAPVKGPKCAVSVKVSDFGLARMKERDAGWQTLTSAAGTAHWMAPEVASGRYTEKVDVYSYSMVLFEIICKEVPFEDENAKEAMRLHMKGHRPDKEAIPPDVPEHLEEIMVSCWAQEPEKRPSFGDVCKMLAKIKV